VGSKRELEASAPVCLVPGLGYVSQGAVDPLIGVSCIVSPCGWELSAQEF
jgi:hypothetical protein